MKNEAPIRRTVGGLAPTLMQGDFALGVMAGIICVVSGLIILQMMGTAPNRSEWLQLTPTLFTLLVATVSLLISRGALHEQRLLRQAGTDPVVLAHLGQRSDEPMIIDFCISNVGAGAAMNVKFEANIKSESLKERNSLVDVTQIKHPIRTILQNTSVRYNLGVGFEIAGDDPLPPFEVRLSCENIEGERYEAAHTIDVRELSLRPANRPPLTKICKDTEDMAKHLGNTSRTLTKLEARLEELVIRADRLFPPKTGA